jgi:hypothetical protein
MRMRSEMFLARFLPPSPVKRQLAMFRPKCLTMTSFGSFVLKQDIVRHEIERWKGLAANRVKQPSIQKRQSMIGVNKAVQRCRSILFT